MPAVSFSLDGEQFNIDSGQLTAIDARDFRTKLGTSIAAVFAAGALDLDVIAGLVWLAKRKRDPSLTFERVASRITYDTVLVVGEDEPPPKVETDDPET